MIFRRIKAHIEKENWFAVFIDFLIVVVGVFIGIQVANWNEEKTLTNNETELLRELKKETQRAIVLTDQKIHSYSQVSAAGKRSLEYLSSGVSCKTECWPVLVDFLHASQWQNVGVPRSTYDSMRRIGLPRNNEIVDAVEAYLAQNAGAIPVFSILPRYRDVVRQLVPLKVHEYYWLNCYSIIDGVEAYDSNCAKGVSDDIAFNTIEAISQHPEIKPSLVEWMSLIIMLPTSLSSQNASTELATAAIEAELERR